jgi:hypothetical protein
MLLLQTVGSSNATLADRRSYRMDSVNIGLLAEVPEPGPSGREHAAEMLLNLGRQNRASGSVQRREIDQTETDTTGQQGDLDHVREINEFDLDTFIDPDLLASFMDGSMADMSQLPFDYC